MSRTVCKCHLGRTANRSSLEQLDDVVTALAASTLPCRSDYRTDQLNHSTRLTEQSAVALLGVRADLERAFNAIGEIIRERYPVETAGLAKPWRSDAPDLDWLVRGVRHLARSRDLAIEAIPNGPANVDA